MSELASLLISSFSIWKRAALKQSIMFGLLSLLCFGLLPACAPPSSPPTITYEPIRPAKEIVIDDDRTGSVKDWVYDSGLRLAVRNLASIVHTGQGSITVIIRQIDHDSHVPEATLVKGRIDAVKPMPLQPVLPPFLDPMVRKQIMTQYTDQKREAEASLKQAQIEANQLETHILSQDSHHVPIDPQWGTDVIGSWIAASEWYSSDRGTQRYLVTISDLVQNLDVSKGAALQLPHVTASVVFYCSDPAKVCQDRKHLYEGVLEKAGAKVMFYDISQVDLVNGVFGK